MNDDITSIFSRFRQKGILIDTNILLLYFIGTVNPERISRFNRTQQFIPEDYELLLKILKFFQKVVTTPNVLTEVNSLANQLGEPERSQCFTIFAQFAQSVDFCNEHYIKSQNAVSAEKFVKFGLTDCRILALARENYLVLTDDLKLANYLQSVEIDVINFNNIRALGWS